MDLVKFTLFSFFPCRPFLCSMQTAQGGGHRTLLYGHAILLRHSYSGMVSARVACSPPVVMLIRLCICGQEIFGNPISLMALTSLVVCFFFF